MLFIKKHYFYICLFLILVLASLLRFYNYSNRWGLAYDQAHDVLVARYAVQNFKIPLVGPFSSAGPFQTGGEWYWFIMIGTLLNLNSVIAPWILLTLLSVVFVALISLFGKEFKGNVFGLLLGIITAVSSAQISQSTNLTNQSLLALTTLLSIWSILRHYKTHKTRYMFLSGLFVGLGPTLHLQGTSVMILPIIYLLLTKSFSKKQLGFFVFGFFIPMIPIVIFDIKNNFVNTRNMLHYYMVDQYKISFDQLGRRWITYLSNFWPSMWGLVVGGNKFLGLICMIMVYTFSLYKFLTRKMDKEIQILFISSILMIILLRYIHTPIFASYLLFFHPFIFILTGWVLWLFFKKNIILALILLFILVFGSLFEIKREILTSTNTLAYKSNYLKEHLVKKFPDVKFSIYDFKYKSPANSFSIVLFLDSIGKISNTGYKIGLGNIPSSERSKYKRYVDNPFGFELWDLEASSPAVLEKTGWANVNPSVIYESTENWNKK